MTLLSNVRDGIHRLYLLSSYIIKRQEVKAIVITSVLDIIAAEHVRKGRIICTRDKCW